jgi:hypothetical protein
LLDNLFKDELGAKKNLNVKQNVFKKFYENQENQDFCQNFMSFENHALTISAPHTN